MIIGLTGPKESGKDTVGAMLIKGYGYERRAFADPLKKSVAGLFDIPFSHVDKLKADPHAIVSLTVHETGETHDMTFRVFLQRYGTEAHRDVPEMGSDFWVDLTLPHNGYYANRDVVITDVRFDNEARRIHAVGGKVVEISRAAAASKDQHSSEAGIDPALIDYTLFNNDGLDDLQTGVEIMLERLNVD